MEYSFCGRSGLLLPRISLGLWHNFGDADSFSVANDMICHAFDRGVTHFDLANNYGPPPGSAERNFGKILAAQLKGHRDEIIISTKAGHRMWPGPYGDGGSRKCLMASIDQSLLRTGLDYFDVFYSHRFDPQTPIEETVQTLIDIVRQGKALYVGLSKYPAAEAEKAYAMMRAQHVHCAVYQDKYNLLHRAPEAAHFALNGQYGAGFAAFSPLAQGILTDRYLRGIPADSRAGKAGVFLKAADITADVVACASRLNSIAAGRSQSLAGMSLAWLLHHPQVTTVIIGASSVAQIDDSLCALNSDPFTSEQLAHIDSITGFCA